MSVACSLLKMHLELHLSPEFSEIGRDIRLHSKGVGLVNWCLLLSYQHNFTMNPVLDIESTDFGTLKKNTNCMDVCSHLWRLEVMSLLEQESQILALTCFACGDSWVLWKNRKHP